MASAATIRVQVESALARKYPSALTPPPRMVRPVVSSGIGALDELIQGGLPVGALTELVGEECSGRMSLALSFLSQITAMGKVCAWIDASNTFDPSSAASVGVAVVRRLPRIPTKQSGQHSRFSRSAATRSLPQIAYASAYIKVKYLAAFTCAMMNNQPMGFYSPAVIVEDARRHGLRVKPIDIQVSDWPCTIEHEDDRSLSLRLGLGYVRGLRSQCAEAAVRARSNGLFRSVDDLVLRVPQLNRKELSLLANVGALNSLDGVEHRRDALWQIERAGKPEGPLLMQQSELLRDDSPEIPLEPMTAEERLVADYAVSSVTTGPHPMSFRREELRRRGYLRAADLAQRPHG